MIPLNVLILGVDEEASLLADFLKEKELYVQLVRSYDAFEKAVKEQNYDVCVYDVAFPFKGHQDAESTIQELKEKHSISRVFCMSYLDTDNYDLPLHEDGHVYKPLTKRDMEIFYRVLLNEEKKDLVCLFFGLRFYASPERARILKSRIEDFLLKNFESEGLVGIDVHHPPVDLTPTVSKLIKSKKRTGSKKNSKG